MKAFSRDARAASRAAGQAPYAPTKLRVAALPWDRIVSAMGATFGGFAKFVTPLLQKVGEARLTVPSVLSSPAFRSRRR